MSVKVVAAGHIALDFTPVIPDGKGTYSFVPGTLINTENMKINLGGSISNTGLAMDFFGACVTLIGKIGNDFMGDIALKILKEHNAEKNMIVSDNGYTSYTIIVSPPKTDRMFLHGVGLNNSFCYNDLDFNKIAESELFHIGYPNIMESLYKNDGLELINILKKVKSLGLLTSVDLAFADLDSKAGRIKWNPILEHLLPYVDFFVPSIEEILAMMDREKYNALLNESKDGSILSVLSVEKDVLPLAYNILDMGAKAALIKCGALGMLLKTAPKSAMDTLDKRFSCWGGITHFEESYVPDCYVSSTGAGDTSIAAFLTSALMGVNPRKCLQYATATGASCITSYDSLSGLISFNEIDKKITNGWMKNKLYQ